jgi:hypothetical protein
MEILGLDIEKFFPKYVRVLNAYGPPDRKQMETVYNECGLKIVGPPLDPALFRV